jgi:hypothetical protein
MHIRIQIQAKSEQIFFRVNFFFIFYQRKSLFTNVILSNMLFYTFYDGLSVFWLRFSSQFRLILHLLDPDADPHSECGSESRKPIECGSNADSDPKHCKKSASFKDKTNDFHSVLFVLLTNTKKHTTSRATKKLILT